MRTDGSAPASLYSITFAYEGASDAILLRDHHDGWLGRDTPEWTAAGSRAPAAYVRGARPSIRVVLSRPPKAGPPVGGLRDTPDRQATVYAVSDGGPGVAPKKIALRFDGNGRTAPIEFRLAERLPDKSGLLHLRWSWRIRVASQEFALGTSAHEICLTARRILDPAIWLGRKTARMGAGAPWPAPWTYSRIIEWACRWTAGLHDKKDIVDAILKNLPSSKLRYAVDQVKSLDDMLVRNGGYCEIWTYMFQALAASQGVWVDRRYMIVDWRVLSKPDRELWSALVVRKGGINRTEPARQARRYRDVGVTVAREARAAVVTVTERRYSFEGVRNGRGDGHAFNVLRYRGSYYLYDASYLLGPVRLERPLPKRRLIQHEDVANLGNFHRDYLSKAVDFMRGSLPFGSNQRASRDLTVPTALLDTPGTLTFYWF